MATTVSVRRLTVMSTVIEVSGSGWHSGISEEVCLAAMIPAMRAVPIASPFGSSPVSTAATTSGRVSTHRLGDRAPFRDGFLTDIHHVGGTVGAQVGEGGVGCGSVIDSPDVDGVAGVEVRDPHRHVHEKCGCCVAVQQVRTRPADQLHSAVRVEPAAPHLMFGRRRVESRGERCAIRRTMRGQPVQRAQHRAEEQLERDQGAHGVTGERDHRDA